MQMSADQIDVLAGIKHVTAEVKDMLAEVKDGLREVIHSAIRA